MAAVDALADWWRWQVTVHRFEGTGAYGDAWAEPTTEVCAIDDRRRQVRDASGDQVVSETTVLLPHTTPDVPIDSTVVLPARFGGREARVIAASRHDSGGQDTPNHLELALT